MSPIRAADPNLAALAIRCDFSKQGVIVHLARGLRRRIPQIEIILPPNSDKVAEQARRFGFTWLRPLGDEPAGMRASPGFV